jgi:hypothetical protein
MTIITAAEAIRYSPVENSFPESSVDDHIGLEEENALIELLGEDFYNILIADLIDYSGTAEYDPDTTYSNGNKVVYEGRVFESLADSNTTLIGDPLDTSKWKEADKFTTECYNDLYFKGHLRTYLSCLVIIQAVPHVTFKTGASGVIEKRDDKTSIRTAQNQNYSQVLDALYRRKEIAKKAMIRHIENNQKICDFSKVKFIDCYTLEMPKRGRKTFYRR